MTVTRGNQHNFFGMEIVSRDDHKFEITMKQYLQESIKAFPETITRASRTPAKENLFDQDTDDNKVKLNEMEAEVFHHIVAKLLYVAKRARPDIDLTVFLAHHNFVNFYYEKKTKQYISNES